MKTYKLEEKLMETIKWSLAFVIISMGAIGYYRFFTNGEFSISILLVIVLFIVIEIAILALTTSKFSDTVKQEKTINLFLYIAIFVMWVIATIGIDSTIWHLVEDKYKIIQQDKAIIESDNIRLENLNIQLKDLKDIKNKYLKKQVIIEENIAIAKKNLDKHNRRIIGTIYSVKDCEASRDCVERKKIALDNKEESKVVLDKYYNDAKMNNVELNNINQQIIKIQPQIDSIIEAQANFTKKHSASIQNKEHQSAILGWITNTINELFGTNYDNPNRVFVFMLSVIVYPIYILFVAFVASNSSEMKEFRKNKQLKEQKNKQSLKSAIAYVGKMLKKIVYYLITTRARKINKVEIEVEKEVEVEVEKVIYKDGKEIQKVEVEKPVIIEKEKLVEKVVHQPVVEKEFVFIPQGTDISKFSDLIKDKNLSDEEIKNVFQNGSIKLKGKKDENKYKVA